MFSFRSSVLATIVATLAAFPGAVSAAPGDISLISVRLTGQTTSMYASYGAHISADGHFLAFFSSSPDLVANFNNPYPNLFVRNLQTGVTEVERLLPSGTLFAANDIVSISSDGRYLAFSSAAPGIVTGDTNGVGDVFVRDRQTGTTERVSLSSGGVQGAQVSYAPSISADGRYVAFASRAANLVPGDTNKADDIFVRDRQTGRTERISVNTAGTQGNGTSFAPTISPDGRFVAFTSKATNLAPGDTNGSSGVFVHDRQTGITERVSVGAGGAQANADSDHAAMSADGRYIAFVSNASNLVPGDTNAAPDIFVRDRQAGTTERANVNSSGGQTTVGYLIGNPSISADGRFVAFSSDAGNLVSNDTNGAADMFVRDRLTGQTLLASVGSGGMPANDSSTGGSLSADGRYLAFDSVASNLVPGDYNGLTDVFVRDRQLSSLIVASTNNVKSTAAGSLSGIADLGGCSEPLSAPSMSADGRYVAFVSTGPDLAPGQPLSSTIAVGLQPHVFVRDRQSGKTALLASGSTGSHIVMSADGSTVGFFGDCTSEAIVDRATGAIDQVTPFYFDSAMNSNGRYVVYRDGYPIEELVTKDRQTGQTDTVSVSSGGVLADGQSYLPNMSADGRFVAYVSDATNLVTGDTNGASDVFVRDRQAGTTERISVDSNGQQANVGASTQGAPMSADGRFVAFDSNSTNLVAGDLNGYADVFVKDRQTGVTERISQTSAGVGGNGDSSFRWLSPDGRFVVFHSNATNLAPSYSGNFFIHDRQTGVTDGLFPDPNTENDFPTFTNNQYLGNEFAMSADQRYIVFSTAESLVKTDINQSALAFGHDGAHGPASIAQDVYLVERGTSTSSLTVAPKSLAFASQPTGTTSTARVVTVTNTSTAAVPITGISLAGANPGQFSFTHNCGTSLAGNAACTVKVKFKPTTKGAKSAVLNVNGGGGGLRTVTLTGTGT